MSYLSAILADSPTFVWPLNETSGTSAADATGNGHTGTYTGGYTQSQACPFSAGTFATLFDGTTGYISGPGAGTSPNVFSIEMLISTTSVGPLGTFSAGNLGNGTYDRMLYISTTGKLAMYVFTSGGYTDPLSSATANDGSPHYCCATLDGSGNLNLYLDTSTPVTATGYTGLADYSGHWMAGGGTAGNTGGGSSAGSNNGNNGIEAFFAVYSGTALTSTQVGNHIAALSGGGGAAATPAPLVVPSLAAIQAAIW